jgi:DNA-binding MarR family transcriptional regulator
MAGDQDQAGSGQSGSDGGGCAGDPCGVDWAAIATSLSAEKFAELSPQARRMALVERSARFAVEFSRWKDAGRTDGIAFEHMRLLQALNWSGPAIMREVGDKLLITPRNMTAMVDQLEGAHLVVRRPYPADRRATLLELTPAGKRMADSALLPRYIAMGEIFDQFTEEEQQKFYIALGCLVEVMHDGGSC